MRYPDPPKGRVIEWHTDTFDTREITNVYFIVEWWTPLQWLAHTMLSFEFSDGRVITPSVEIRPKVGQHFGPIKGLQKAFGIHYVWSTEADALLSRMYANNKKPARINMIEAVISHQAAVRLFEACVERTHELHTSDGYYHSITNSCTSNIFDIAQHAVPAGRFKRPGRLVLPGYTPRLLARSGALRMHGDFRQTMKATRVSDLILEIGDADDFSQQLRSHRSALPR